MVATLGAIQQGVRDYVQQPTDVAGALQARTITPPVHFDIGLSTSDVIDEPVIGFGNDGAGGGDGATAQERGGPP